MHWRLALDEDVIVQSESATWDVAITWSRRLWARTPQPWPARETAALMAAYLQAVADWAAPPPPARWSRLMRAGRSGWPVGLSRPPTDTGTLLHYAMGESACTVAGPHPELVGRAVPVAVLDLAERGACEAVLSVGAPASLQRTAPEVVLSPPSTSRAQFLGYTIQPLGGGPRPVFPARAAPPGLLAARLARRPRCLLPRGGGAPGGPSRQRRWQRAPGGGPALGPGARRRRGRRVPLASHPPPPPLPPPLHFLVSGGKGGALVDSARTWPWGNLTAGA